MNESSDEDFVIVKVMGKSRTLNYIARVDVVIGIGQFEGLFLKRVFLVVEVKFLM